ncbi:hypothetical protein ONZ45_g9284 [Pleurotus djamor]|nr:hypothetical protein ONZ45_g9284 [Pleurotus djamor]
MQTRTISGSTDLDVSPTTSNTPTHPHLPTLQIRESWNYESPTRDTLYVTHISITQHFSATHDGVNNAVPRHFDILDIFTVFFVSPWKLIRTRCNRVSLRAARTDFCGFNSPKHEYTMNRKTRHKYFAFPRQQLCPSRSCKLYIDGVITKLTSTLPEKLDFPIQQGTLPYDRNIPDFPTYPPLSARAYEGL